MGADCYECGDRGCAVCTPDDRLDNVRRMIETELHRILKNDLSDAGGGHLLRGRRRAWTDGVRIARGVEEDKLFDILTVLNGAQVHECDNAEFIAGDEPCARCGWLPS